MKHILTRDKIAHIFICVFLMMGGIFLEELTQVSYLYTGLFFVTMFSILKEWYDANKPNPTGFDIYDIIANYIGAVGTIICVELFKLIELLI